MRIDTEDGNGAKWVWPNIFLFEEFWKMETSGACMVWGLCCCNFCITPPIVRSKDVYNFHKTFTFSNFHIFKKPFHISSVSEMPQILIFIHIFSSASLH